MSARHSSFAAACAVLFFAHAAPGHEVRPGYLELHEVSSTRFELFWKVPARGADGHLRIRPAFPNSCTVTLDTTGSRVGDAWIERGTVQCAAPLEGGAVTIDGLEATGTDVLARVVRADGSEQVARLSPAKRAFEVAAAPGVGNVALAYLQLGVEHILLGIDHLLFVLALMILVRGGRRLFATVTAFTVAHSLTLAAATLGFVHVPQMPVEAAIALSIVFVAAEIVHSRQGRPGLTERQPWIVAFTFGLLHGLGFAGALADVGLPARAIPVALLFFNLGVEIGQLGFIAVILAAWSLAQGLHRDSARWAARAAPYVIGTVAAYWTIERVARF